MACAGAFFATDIVLYNLLFMDALPSNTRMISAETINMNRVNSIV